MGNTQQLVKKSQEGYDKVFPKTFLDAIKDRETGMSLTDILSGFNNYFLSYSGDKSTTRLQVPSVLRREGLWITYVDDNRNVITEWYNNNSIDDKSWSDSSNWRIASNYLVGNISISDNGKWVINNTETEFNAIGETGITPLLRMGPNNKIQVSYNEGKSWKDISDYVVPKFRWVQGSGTTAGKIQISMDLGSTWTDLSNNITNNLRISKYIGPNESLPTSGIAEGTIYMKGPIYDENDTLNENPIYRMWVYAWKGNTLAWQDNGEFQSIAAGIVQETGDSEVAVMSQKAVSEKLSELGSKDGDISLIDLNNKSLWHIGGIDSTTGKEVSDNKRLKTDYIQWSHLGEWVSKSEINSFPVYCYDINKSYLGYFNIGAKTNLSSIQILYPNTFYIRLGVILNDQASVDIIGNSVILNKIYTNLQNKEIDNKIKLFKDEYSLFKKDVEQKEGGTTKLNLNDASIWHIGEISSRTGEIREKTSRLYSDLIPSIDRGLFVKEKNTELELSNYTVYCYDCTLKYLGFYAKSGNLASSLNVWDDYPNTYFIRLGVIFAEGVLADLSLIGNGIILNEIYINKTMQDFLINHKSIIRDNIKYMGSPTEVNLSDVSIWYQGGIDTASGKVNTSTNRLYSEMLNVVDGNFKWNKLSDEVTIGAANIYIYDETKKYLGYKPILILSPLKVEDLLLEYPNFMYIRFSFIALNNTELIPSMIGVDISWDNVKILPFNKKTIIEQVEENTKAIEKSFSNNGQSILSGKKLVACGDSFTYGDFSTITDDKGLKGKDSPELWDSEYNCWKSYSYWVAKRNDMKYINDGIGGTTIAYIESHSAKDKAFSVQRYKNIPSDADYITLKFGINDGHQNVTLGTINDTDNTTFYGAWNVVLKYLVENFPYAKIGVIISNGLDYNELADATIECCKKWGVPYLDEVYDEKVPLLHRVNRPGVNSSVKTAKLNAFRISAIDSHPNPKAHLYESTFVEGWLKSL